MPRKIIEVLFGWEEAGAGVYRQGWMEDCPSLYMVDNLKREEFQML